MEQKTAEGSIWSHVTSRDGPECSTAASCLCCHEFRDIVLTGTCREVLSCRDVVYGCETWSLTLREERRLRVFENWVLRRMFGAKMNEVTGSGENYIARSLMICTAHPILFG